MEHREYISIRRSYNLVRQDLDSSRRLTFQELAALCRLYNSKAGLKTSDIAAYQGCLRPTMTHRTKHLEQLGLIGRERGGSDRRNVVCFVSDEGTAYVREVSERICKRIGVGHSLARTTPERICRYVDAMGCVECDAGELILLGLLLIDESPVSVSRVVDGLGFLQPTVSMSISSLEADGLVVRVPMEGRRSQGVMLTDAGAHAAKELADRISEVIVRRGARKKAAAQQA